MKKILIVIALMSTFILAEAQTAKKYIFLEHFTNTYCSICSSRNPIFYSTIANYADNVHHIAVHPKVPYQQCSLYNANQADNEARRVHHNIFGTPKVFMNGKSTQSNPLIRADQLDAELNKKTSVGIQISAIPTNNAQSGEIEIFTTGDLPTGNLKLYIAAVEKLVDFSAPNGEKEHHDVLRKFVSANTGDAFVPAASGQSVKVSYDFDFENSWVSSQMYVLAWIENADTKEVLNSGSQFDPPVEVSSSTTKINALPIVVQPNPATDIVRVAFDQPVSGLVTVQNLSGQTFFNEKIEQNSTFKQLNISDLEKGVYLLRVETETGIGIKKIIKQ